MQQASELTGEIAAVYHGGNATLRVLRALGWGAELLNLGAFRWRGPLNFLNLVPFGNGLHAAQVRLVDQAIRHLALSPGDRVLDVATGRGRAAYQIAMTNPGVEVTGLDLVASNVAVATALFGQCRNVRYVEGDAAKLPFQDAAFDRVQCLEAAFHFPDKAAFLRESARVLKGGGRLVLVDFMWKDGGRALAASDARFERVRKIWSFDDFASKSEYEAMARSSGFEVTSYMDWTTRVTKPLQWQFEVLAKLGASSFGRALLTRTNPMLRGVTRRDWVEIKESASAHRFVRRHAVYAVMILTKSGRSVP